MCLPEAQKQKGQQQCQENCDTVYQTQMHMGKDSLQYCELITFSLF